MVKKQSQPARHAIEREFDLKRAEDYRFHQTDPTQPVHLAKIQYGKTGTFRAISTVLDAVLPDYRYTTMAELNTILRDYNVMADEGGENSLLRQRGGLLYSIIDEQGKKVGIPIKASDFHNKPTLKFLQKQFARNKQLRESEKSRLGETIDRQKIPPPTPKEKISSEKQRQKKRKRLHL